MIKTATAQVWGVDSAVLMVADVWEDGDDNIGEDDTPARVIRNEKKHHNELWLIRRKNRT